MNSLEIGPLYLMFMRTVRVKKLDTSSLPPGMGTMEIYKVSEYEKNCPKNWDKEGYFIAMHDTEAMWMNFQCCTPVAVLISAGGINALSGEKSNNKLVKDNYLVTPPQPWLDGWKSDDGSVYQFVSTNAGEGLSVGEQLIDTQDHGMQISVFEPKNPEKMHSTARWDVSLEGAVACCSSKGAIQLQSFSGCSFTASEMSMGKGGKIEQKIYEDPHGIEEWKEVPVKTVKIYLINAAQFAEITGTKMPPGPVGTDDYQGPWFNLQDDHMKDIAGTQVFDNLKTL